MIDVFRGQTKSADFWQTLLDKRNVLSDLFKTFFYLQVSSPFLLTWLFLFHTAFGSLIVKVGSCTSTKLYYLKQTCKKNSPLSWRCRLCCLVGLFEFRLSQHNVIVHNWHWMRMGKLIGKQIVRISFFLGATVATKRSAYHKVWERLPLSIRPLLRHWMRRQRRLYTSNPGPLLSTNT